MPHPSPPLTLSPPQKPLWRTSTIRAFVEARAAQVEEAAAAP